MKHSNSNDQSNSILMNFRIPGPLKADFQASCGRQHISMTAVINMTIRQFVETERLEPGIQPAPYFETDDSWRDLLT